MGPSGAGKSTLLRVLAGVEPLVGSLSVLGEDWSRKPAWERQVGWVPQDSLLFPHLNVRENLSYSGKGPVEEVAEMLELSPLMHRKPRMLSGGEKQRVALGRALCSRPRVLLLDEPFSALDRALKQRLRERLKAQLSGLPTVLVSHDEADLQALGAERWDVEEKELRRLD